jgi:hypothetical protein
MSSLGQGQNKLTKCGRSWVQVLVKVKTNLQSVVDLGFKSWSGQNKLTKTVQMVFDWLVLGST